MFACYKLADAAYLIMEHGNALKYTKLALMAYGKSCMRTQSTLFLNLTEIGGYKQAFHPMSCQWIKAILGEVVGLMPLQLSSTRNQFMHKSVCLPCEVPGPLRTKRRNTNLLYMTDMICV